MPCSCAGTRRASPTTCRSFYNDAILLKSAIALQTPDVPLAGAGPGRAIPRKRSTRPSKLIRIGEKLDEFVRKNTEMGQLIDGISVVNQDMLKRNADLERRNEELLAAACQVASWSRQRGSRKPE